MRPQRDVAQPLPEASRLDWRMRPDASRSARAPDIPALSNIEERANFGPNSAKSVASLVIHLVLEAIVGAERRPPSNRSIIGGAEATLQGEQRNGGK